jgi:hypothetical protein
MSSSHDRAVGAAGLSLLYPGLGQALQGRGVLATWLALEFTGLVVAGLVWSGLRALWWGLALLVGVYAIVDAYRHDRRREPVARVV